MVEIRVDRRLNEAGARRVARGPMLRPTVDPTAQPGNAGAPSERANRGRKIQGPPYRSKCLSSLERKRDKRERTVPTGMPSVAATST